MGDIGCSDLGAQILMKRPAERGDLAIEVHGGCGDEGHSEDAGEYLADIVIGEFDLVAHENGCCLGNRPDEGVTKFIRRCLKDRPATLGTEGGVVDKLCHKGFRLKNDILLTACLFVLGRFQG